MNPCPNCRKPVDQNICALFGGVFLCLDCTIALMPQQNLKAIKIQPYLDVAEWERNS